MKHYMNNTRPDDDAGGVAMDMRDTRPFWKRVVMLFQGWCMFARGVRVPREAGVEPGATSISSVGYDRYPTSLGGFEPPRSRDIKSVAQTSARVNR